MKNLTKIFCLLVIISLLSSCAGTFTPKTEEESLTTKTNPDGSVTVKYTSKTFDGSRRTGPLNLAKAGNTNPDNAVAITSTGNTKVSTKNTNSNRTYRTEKGSSASSSSSVKPPITHDGAKAASSYYKEALAKKQNKRGNVGVITNNNL